MMLQKDYYFYPPKNPQFFFPVQEFKKYQKYYTPFSNKSKYFWCLYVKFKFVRFFFRINEANILLPISIIKKIVNLDNASYFYNIGTKGVHQKATIIAQNKDGQKFLKFAQKEQAKELVKNETKILLELNKQFKLKTAKVLENNSNNLYAYLLTEVIEGNKLSNLELNNNIFKLLTALCSKILEKDNFKQVFAHGDFCPWNILVAEKNQLVLIDWEMAGSKILGYDLFTFIFQTSFLLYPQKKVSDIISINKVIITKYFKRFETENWEDYLIKFALIKIYEEQQKKNYLLVSGYKKIVSFYES